MNPTEHTEDAVLAFCGPMIERAAKRYHIQGMDRDDVRQEASTAVLLAVRAWNGEMPFLGYARNKVLQRLTQLLREAERREDVPAAECDSPDPLEPIDPAPGPDAQAAAREELERIRRLLDPREAWAVELTYWDGATQAEVAAVMGVSGETVQGYLSRARKKLAKDFGPSSRLGGC